MSDTTTTWTEVRTAKQDPAAYVAAINRAYDVDFLPFRLTARLVSVDPARTKSGRHRFTIALTKEVR